jgi:histidine phosphotransfer protein HptB
MNNMTQLANSSLPASRAVLDFEVLSSFEQVKSDDGSDILIELIDLYLRSAPRRLLTIRKAAAENDWASLKREVHTLKGSSSTLGLRQIAKTCQEIEATSSSSPGDLDRLIRFLGTNFVEAQSVLTAERNRRVGEDRRLTKVPDEL